MRIGLVVQLHGRPDGPNQPAWDSIHELAKTAEEVGFDMFVFEDVLLYRGEEHTDGCWESMAIAAALAASTEHISLGQSVINSPYRSPTLLAAQATTLDEISDGRYVLGIGAGNSDDYEDFGFPPDHRFSRFEEAIQIIHTLLHDGRVSFDGRFYEVGDAEIVLRGPSPNGPQINIAGAGPKMLRLAARYGDAWNWWAYDETVEEMTTRLTPILETLEEACRAEDRATSDLDRTLDLYSVTPPGFEPPDGRRPLSGSADELSSTLLRIEELGFSEVRCDLTDNSTEAVSAMKDVVDLVHSA